MIETINGIKIFKTEIAVTSEEKVNENLHLKDLGISSSIEDEDVTFVTAWIVLDQITMVETTVDGFNILLKNGDTVYSKENPFA